MAFSYRKIDKNAAAAQKLAQVSELFFIIRCFIANFAIVTKKRNDKKKIRTKKRIRTPAVYER